MRYFITCLLYCSLTACQRRVFKEKWLHEQAPENFQVLFETSRGKVEAGFTRSWSPAAVDRLYAQLKHGYYDGVLFYRVCPGYVAQFGGHDAAKIAAWGRYPITDEPVHTSNERGTISFARSGKDSRGNDLFINLGNNSPRLDTINYNGVKGFPVLGTITAGMSTVDSLYSGYCNEVFGSYDTLLHNKAVFLRKFPKIDSLKRASIVHKN